MSSLSPLGSNYNRSVFVSTCVGAAICAGLYVIWGPEHFFRKKGKCPGLLNLGNSCFINSILQSLAALPEVRSWLMETAASQGGRLVLAINDILSTLDEDSDQICSARNVLQALAVHRWRIDSRQQDAHEFYHILMSTLDEELIVCPSLMDVIKSSNRKCNGVWTRAGLVPVLNKKLTSPFRGMLSSELYCIQCNYLVPLKYEFFESISLTLQQYKCTLENSLLEFIKSEVVHDVTCARCSKRAGQTVKRTHLKRLQLGRAPRTLCIHMNRTVWLADGSLIKNDHHMRFPVQLDASVLLKGDSTSSRELLYVLCAVVEHRGGPNSGHYITYRRCGHAGGSGWVSTSDSAVYSASLNEVLAAEAYMLFYCRKRERRKNSNLSLSQ